MNPKFDESLLSLPALSIRQPWAWLILHGQKDIENRSWPTRFRGRFLIHAAQGMTMNEYQVARNTAQAIYEQTPSLRIQFPARKDLERGGIVGVAEIVDCVTRSDSPWFFGDYGFVLRNVECLTFFPCKGKLGFFKVK